MGKLTITIQGAAGEQIVASSGDALTSNLPDKIKWITFDSAASLQARNATPLNRFKLHLDFTEPPGFNSYDPWKRAAPARSPTNLSAKVLGLAEDPGTLNTLTT